MQKLQDSHQFFLTKKFTFDAAHKLLGYDGKCKNLHGHTYSLEVTIVGEVDQNVGMVLDFKIMKRIIKKSVIERIDHQYINNIIENPTAENTVKWVWDILYEKFNDYNVELFKIRLWETPDSCVTFLNKKLIYKNNKSQV